jgi:enediyne biosynthesis protein E4
MLFQVRNTLAQACSIIVVFSFMSCSDRKEQTYQFKLLTSVDTNLDFNNSLHQTTEMNIMNYMYFYNGGGVGAGDFNSDGRVDLFFTSNLGTNKLYLNQGGFKFLDITGQAKLGGITGWSTGVSIVDINNDGLLDIYVNQVGGFRNLNGKNKLFVCKGVNKGIPYYEDLANVYGLDIVGFSTQSSFFDYDLDGDLDMFLLNHSVHENGTFGERESFKDKVHPTAGDKLFQNTNGKFVDVTLQSGVKSLVIGYGLGIATSDVNNDGWPDIYIGNDFHENDYLYINQRNGTFKEMLEEQIMHTSKFSMGVDIADFNNDGFTDIVSLDMKPSDPFILKSSLGEDNYTIFNFKLDYGYAAQFARNNLQMNNGNGTFSEIAMFSKIHATDWSWAPLFMDFDNDGYKDLFISNGIVRRMNDIDYVNFRESSEDHKWKTQANRMEEDDLHLLENIPEVKLPNKFFKNSGSLLFEDISYCIKDNLSSFSNGAVYADFDDDGDLDIVTNNINDTPFVYNNLSVANGDKNACFLSFDFEGSPQNVAAVGAKIIVFKKEQQLVYENFPTRGFQSSMHVGIHIGIGNKSQIDSAIVIWPDHGYQSIDTLLFNKKSILKWSSGLPKYTFKKDTVTDIGKFSDITNDVKLYYTHKENDFGEFDRESLIPFMVSTEGPAVAVADINGDGLEDVFFGSSKRFRSTIFTQTKSGTFSKAQSPTIAIDSVFEDVDALFRDIDNDGDQDLVVASGGNEFWGDSEYLKQRFYLNNGKGDFSASLAFPNAFLTASCVVATDFNRDGLVDFFFGARAQPKGYGIVPKSYLFKNSGNGHFEDVTDSYAVGLRDVGLVTDASSVDIDGDRDDDLLVSVEWGSIKLFMNEGNSFQLRNISDHTGLWTYIQPFDYDSDGDVDFIAGNSGLNTQLTASSQKPIRMYVKDFDSNGTIEQIVTYYLGNKEVTLANHSELLKQLPYLKKDFLYAKDFAAASPEELIGKEILMKSLKYEVNTLSNCYFENTGGQSNFKVHPLPQRLQLSTIRAGAVTQSTNGKGSTNVLLTGNFYDNNTELGRYDSDFGSLLEVTSKGELYTTSLGSLKIKGQVRRVIPIKIKNSICYLIVKNNDTVMIIKN